MMWVFGFFLHFSSCESCIEDVTCGFCYVDLGEGVVNGTGSCLVTSREDSTKSLEGRCNQTGLEDTLVWAYDYCPTAYSWMAILGLVVYLMFFAPGESNYCLRQCTIL